MTYQGQDGPPLVIVDQRRGCLFWFLVAAAIPAAVIILIFTLGLLSTLAAK